MGTFFLHRMPRRCIASLCLLATVSLSPAYGQIVPSVAGKPAQDVATPATEDEATASDKNLAGDPNLVADVPEKAEASRESGEGKRHSKRILVGGKLGISAVTFGGPDADRGGPGEDILESTYKLGFSVSVSARLSLLKHWSIVAEAGYATRGSGVRYQGVDMIPFDFSCLELAALGQFQWPLKLLDKQLALHALLGLSVGYVLYAGEGDREFDEVKRIDTAIQGGIGLSLKTRKIEWYHVNTLVTYARPSCRISRFCDD